MRPTRTPTLHRPSARGHLTLAAGLLGLTIGLAALGGCATGTPDASPSGTAPVTSSPATDDPIDDPSEDPSEQPTGEPSEGAPATNGPNSILVPGDGAVVDGPQVTVSGDGTAFEATLDYSVTDADGQVVAEGYTMAGANGEVGPYEFTLTLDPGVYTVTVFEPGMGEGDAAGEPLNPVEVTFTVQ